MLFSALGVAGITGLRLVDVSVDLAVVVADIGRVTSFATADLAPGSYHFNLRAVDRAGNWASTYESYGPVEVLPSSPEPHRRFSGPPPTTGSP